MMRRIVPILLGLALVLSVFANGRQAEAKLDPGLGLTVTNDGFEEFVFDGVIPGWTQTFGTAGISVTDTEHYTLNKSLQLVDTSSTGSVGLESSKFDVTAGQTYRAFAKTKIASGAPSLYIRFWDSGNTLLASFSKSISSPVGQWTSMGVTGEAPAGAVKASILLYSSSAAITTAYYDEIYINRTVNNPGFEEVTGTTIAGWTQKYGTTGISADTTNPSSGTYSMKLVDTSATGSVGAESDKIDVAAGESYRASGLVHVATGTAFLFVRFWDASNTLLDSKYSTVSTPTGVWTPISITATAPAGTVKASLLLYSGSTTITTAYFDDVSLSRGFFANLGNQLMDTTVLTGAMGKNSANEDVAYVVVQGTVGDSANVPAKFAKINMKSESLEELIDFTGSSEGAWASTVSTDGTFYAGTFKNAHLFKYEESSADLTDIGQPIAGQTYIWDLEPGLNGKVYGGTYGGGYVFDYTPATGFTQLGGQVEPGELYVRNIAYDPAQNVLYAGIGSHAHLIKYELNTGTKTDILPPAYADKEFVYMVDVVGDKVFAKLSPGFDTLVIDKTTLALDYVIPGSTSRGVSAKSPYDNKVYYTAGGVLHYYDMVAKTHGSLNVNLGSNAVAFKFAQINEPNFSGYSLIGVTAGVTIFKYNVQTGYVKTTSIPLPQTPTQIQNIAKGPDGKIYSGGYLAGELGVYDPVTGIQTQYRGLSQIEGMGELQGTTKMYFGTYTGARLYEYDTALPYSFGTNPKQLVELGTNYEQDRPMAVLPVSAVNKVFIGTVPGYGRLDGALSVYDLSTGALQVNKNIVSNQSVVSLAYKNNEVFGGTSVWGGLGINPTETEAKLFVYDTVSGAKAFEMVPVAGAKVITSVIVGPDGNIWGLADGYLFIFDPSSRTVTYSAKKFSFTYTATKWRDSALAVSIKDGYVYGTVNQKFFKFHPTTKAMTILRQNVGVGPKWMAQDNKGDFYYMLDSSDLWKYDIDPNQ